jgi:hypothetical protein
MLYDLFTSDIIFDKFEICCSPDGKKFASGSYRCTLYLLLLVCDAVWFSTSAYTVRTNLCGVCKGDVFCNGTAATILTDSLYGVALWSSTVEFAY